MNKEFVKYNSIIGSQKLNDINKIRNAGLLVGEWIALEKIHGANFSFYCDGSTVETAGRNGFCDGTFFSSHKVHYHKYNVLTTYMYMKNVGMLKDGDSIIVTGELFGGSFFGEQEKGATKIQKNTDYHPDVQFMAFDVKIVGESHGEKGYILSYNEMMDVLQDIPTPPVVGVGTFDEIMALSNDFPSKVPDYYGLKIPEGKHPICEGFVGKPTGTARYTKAGKRCIFKSKNSRFKETSDAKPRVVKELPPEEAEFLADFSRYITENRLTSVISKIGSFDWTDFGKVNGLLIKDAIEDYESDNELRIKSDNRYNAVKKRISRLAGDLIREHLERQDRQLLQ